MVVDYRHLRKKGIGSMLEGFLSRRTKGGIGGSNKKLDILFFSRLSRFALFGLIGLIVLSVILFFWFSRDLPTPGKLTNSDLGQSTQIFDRKGILLYSVYKTSNRMYVQLSDIPKYLQEGTISIEDKDFYNNQGFSITGYLRSIRNLVLMKGLSGGSTLTQQLVKNVLLTSERSITRKIKELILAVQVDKIYSKDQILEMYLNDVSYGGANVGVEAAAENYFGKKVKELDLAESAMLSGIPQAPSSYSPYRPEKYYIDRTDAVLTQMVANKYITSKQKDSALLEIKNKQFTSTNANGIKAPHFVMYVKKLLVDNLHFTEAQVESGGLQVTTTLDYEIQKKAEDSLTLGMGKLKGLDVGNGSAIVMDPKTGEILAMVGSKDYFGKSEPKGCNSGKDCTFDPFVNVALEVRQPGSSLKPVVYATSFEKGYTPSTLLMDAKTDFPTGELEHPIFTPTNYDGKFNGPMQVRFALGNSLNIPAVKMLARIGLKPVMQQGYDMGITNWQPTDENIKNVGLSLVLGGREVTLLQEVTAYSTFANQGVHHDVSSVLKVTDSQNHNLFEKTSSKGVKAISAEICFLISSILSDNAARQPDFGIYNSLVVANKTVAAKTGTTDQKRDNWTVGYTPSYVVGVWVGNNDNSVMNPALASGLTGAAPIFHDIMTAILKGKADEPFNKPDNVVQIDVDSLGGGLPTDGHSTRKEYFVKGTEPTGQSAIYAKIKISKHHGDKLANQAEIDHGDYDTKDFIVFKESDPVSTDGKNLWQDGINAWLHTVHSAAESQYYPPTDTSDYKYDSNNQPTSTPTPTSGNQPTPTPTDTQTPTPSYSPTPTQ